jgi:hypothetical protein
LPRFTARLVDLVSSSRPRASAHDLQPFAGEDLGDAGTHRAQPDHAHRVELPAHGRSALIAGNDSRPVSQVPGDRLEAGIAADPVIMKDRAG